MRLEYRVISPSDVVKTNAGPNRSSTRVPAQLFCQNAPGRGARGRDGGAPVTDCPRLPGLPLTIRNGGLGVSLRWKIR